MTDPTQRFSSRVDDYVRYRPSYPKAVLDLLRKDCRLTSASTIADIGSGTGILSELFLENGSRVFGIEPNKEMREAGKRLLEGYPCFTSIAATAEATTLNDGTIDFVAVGQAFHWFEPESTREEFVRILKPDGWVVLVWNERRTDTTPFLVAYEWLLRTYGTDYDAVGHKGVTAGEVRSFFAPDTFTLRTFENSQVFDLESLRGRLLSSSYTPEPGHRDFDAILKELEEIFRRHQVDGKVTFEYDTRIYYGHLHP